MPGLNGLVVMTPTSIASTGTGNSSSIGANGNVTFSSCATLSLNGVFTSSYDNYMIVMRSVGSTSTSFRGRLRASGTDNSTASSYTAQYIDVGGTSISAGRSQNNQFDWFGATYSTQRDGSVYFFYGPYLAQPTAFRQIAAGGSSGAYIGDSAGTHNQSTSYDGVTWIADGGNFSGLVTVFGFNQ